MSTTVEDVYSVLGITRHKDITPLALVADIERGLPVASVERIARLYAPDDPKFIESLVPHSTLGRYKQKRKPLTRDQSDRLVRLARLWVQAISLWQDSHAVRRFMDAPHPLLGGRSPRKMAQTSTGARLVEELLGRLEFGSAS